MAQTAAEIVATTNNDMACMCDLSSLYGLIQINVLSPKLRFLCKTCQQGLVRQAVDALANSSTQTMNVEVRKIGRSQLAQR